MRTSPKEYQPGLDLKTSWLSMMHAIGGHINNFVLFPNGKTWRYRPIGESGIRLLANPRDTFTQIGEDTAFVVAMYPMIRSAIRAMAFVVLHRSSGGYYFVIYALFRSSHVAEETYQWFEHEAVRLLSPIIEVLHGYATDDFFVQSFVLKFKEDWADFFPASRPGPTDDRPSDAPINESLGRRVYDNDWIRSGIVNGWSLHTI